MRMENINKEYTYFEHNKLIIKICKQLAFISRFLKTHAIPCNSTGLDNSTYCKNKTTRLGLKPLTTGRLAAQRHPSATTVLPNINFVLAYEHLKYIVNKHARSMSTGSDCIIDKLFKVHIQ